MINNKYWKQRKAVSGKEIVFRILFGMLVLHAFLAQKSYGDTNNPRIAISPDGRFVAYSYCENGCGIAEFDTKNQSSIIYKLQDGSIQAPSYSPSGKKLIGTYITNIGNKYIRNVASIDRGKYTFYKITNSLFQDFSPVFCRSDATVIFSRALGEKNGRIPVSNIDIYEAHIENNIKVNRVTNFNLGILSGAVCVADGIAFSTLIDGHEKVVLFEPKSGRLNEINTGENDMTLQGGGGKKLLAIRRKGSNFSLSIFDSNGDVIKELPDSGYIGRAAISEDGNHLAYTKGRDGAEIIIIDLVSGAKKVHKAKSIVFSKSIILEERNVSVH